MFKSRNSECPPGSSGTLAVQRRRPEMIDIPKDKAEIKKLLKKTANRGSYHQGLLQALKSERNGRSPRNAYILLLGQTGAGKSSTINFLFDNQQITKTGDSTSETSAILEFSASVPIPELGVANSEIRVIDTPGLGDTRGIENDAKFLATLDSYLQKHEDLSTAIPNIVFIVARFDDNRIDGMSSGFVRMLKGVKLLESQLIDNNFSNVIVVLTHFMHVRKEVRTNPGPRYDLIRRIIKDVGFPEPIIVVGAENEAVEKDLEEMNGYYKLPNGECYPFNIFQRIQQLTVTNDPLGEAIIRTAFVNPASLIVRERCRAELLVDNGNEMYLKAMSKLISDWFSGEETPVSAKLDNVWHTLIHSNLRKLYPGSLSIAQNVFHIRQIREFNQLPKTAEETIKLLKQIPQNEGILTLLEKALGISVPNIGVPILVGNGYNVLQDVSTFSPFIFNSYKPSPLGYKVPYGIKCELVNETDDVCVFSRSRQEYATRRLSDLSMPCELVAIVAGSLEVRSGYNVMQQMDSNSHFSTLREHRMFQLALEPDVKISLAFLESLQALPSFSEQVHIRQMWMDFFDKFGTHVVTSAYGGGSIETFVQENDFKKLVQQSGGDVQEAMKRLSHIDKQIAAEVIGAESFDNQIASVTSFGVKFRGGSMRFHKSNLSLIDSDEAAATLENWRESLTSEPIMLETKLKLVPLSHFVKSVSAKTAGEMDKACESLFSTPFQYTPEKPAIPPKRADILSPRDLLDRNSCLKAGTLILMADWTFKPVEQIVQGDLILDKDLKPSAVIGCNYFFLGDRHFYGFSPESKFFTEVHIFVDPQMTYRTVSTEALLRENPCFEFVGKVQDMSGKFEILKYGEDRRQVEPEECTLHEDLTDYPRDTRVYFLEVDNASGTYFANGFLCRHELPPFHLWPKTFNCLQKMMLIPQTIAKIVAIEFTPDTLQQFSEIAQSIAQSISEGFKCGKLEAKNSSDTERDAGIFQDGEEEDEVDIRKNLGIVLQHRALAAFGLLVYGKCGKILYENLDKDDGRVRDVNMNLLRSIVKQNIEDFLG